MARSPCVERAHVEDGSAPTSTRTGGSECRPHSSTDQRNNSTVDNLKTRVALLENILSSSGVAQAQPSSTQPAPPPPCNPSPTQDAVGVESSGLTPFLGSSPETSTSQSGAPSRPSGKRIYSATSPHDDFSQPERLKVRPVSSLWTQLTSAPAGWATDLRRSNLCVGTRSACSSPIPPSKVSRCAPGLAPEPSTLRHQQDRARRCVERLRGVLRSMVLRRRHARFPPRPA